MPIITALLLFMSAASQAADFSDFLPGAKAMGMGMSYTAVADDAYAMFFNPAGTANTPYIQAGGGLGRQQSPVGTLTHMSLTYLRPYERVNTATVGAAYYAGRQTDGGDKDIFLFNYAQELKVPQLQLSRPLKVGGNFKFINIDKENAKGNFGLGFDAGVLIRAHSGLSASLVLADLMTNVGTRRPVFSLGTAYVWRKWITAAGNLRVRPGLTEYYPGLEFSFYQGLLKARVGKGFQLDGVGQTAFGVGVNLSPVLIDFAATIPFSGVHRRGGGYQASLGYRFGAPSFSGNFVGQAAAQADNLKSEIENLEQRRMDYETQAATVKTNKEVVEGEYSVLRQRVRELEDEHRRLTKTRDELEYQIKELETRRQNAAAPSKPAPLPVVKPAAPAPKPPPPWPKRHTAQVGDTLRGLARTYYGDASLWETIYEANLEKIDRGLPMDGAILTIPEPKR